MSRSGVPVLVVAPLPPPTTGQRLSTVDAIHALRRVSDRVHVHDSAPAWSRRFPRLIPLAALVVWAGVCLKIIGQGARRERVTLYFHLSQSPGSMLRDALTTFLATSMGMSVVSHIHGGGFRTRWEALPAARRQLVTAALRRHERIIILDEVLRSMLTGIVPDERVAVVSNCVPRDVADRVGEVPVQRGGPVKVLFLSNLMESKGYVVFLEAAALLEEEPGIEFVVAGARNEQTTVDPDQFIAASGLENTHYVGPVEGEAKARLLEAADIFVLPSTYWPEGQPISALEALWSGCVVIGSEQGALGGLARDGGSCVPATAPEVAEAILYWARDAPALQRKQRQNQEVARRLYTPDAFARNLARSFPSHGQRRRP